MWKKILNYIRVEMKPYRALFSLAMYGILTFVYTFPLVLNLNRYVIGDLEGDMWKHMWGFWWVKKRLLEDGVLPLFTDLLNYPYGGNLFFIDPLGAFLSLPLQSVFPIHVVYNLLVLFNLIFGAFCAYLSASYFIKNRAAAFYSGAAYGFTAYMLAYITSGVSETFNLGWIPLFLYFFAKTLREKSNLNPVLAGVTIFFAAFGSFYYGSFATIYGILFFLFFAWYQYRRMIYPLKKNRSSLLEKTFGSREFNEASGVSPVPQQTDKKSHGLFSGLFHRSGVRHGQKSQDSKDRMKIVAAIFSLVIMIVSFFALAFAFPRLISGGTPPGPGFYSGMALFIALFAWSVYYALKSYKAQVKGFIYRLKGRFFSNDREQERKKMLLLFALYGLSALGLIYLWSVIMQDAAHAIAGTAFIVGGLAAVSILMTMLQIKGDDDPAGKGKALEGSGASILREYTGILLPWLIFGISTLNIIRVMAFHKKILGVFGSGYVHVNLILSIILLAGAFIYILAAKVYEKSTLYQKLFVNPEIPGGSKDPELLRKTLRRNKLAALVFFLSFVLPPLVLSLQGFPPEQVIRIWVFFITGTALIGGLIYFLAGAGGKKQELPHRKPGAGTYIRMMVSGPLRRVMLMCVVGLTLIGPLFLTFRASLNVDQGLVRRRRGPEFIDLYLSDRFHNISNLADYITPGKELITRTYTVDRLTRSSYAGWITLLLALSSLIVARKRRYIWFWLTAAIFFISLSMGPFLYVTNQIHTKSPSPLYMFLFFNFPFFNHISIPYRFNICAMLALSVMAGYGICHLLRSWNRNHVKIAVTILALAMLFEICILSPAPYPIPLSDIRVPEFYKKIAADGEDYGIIDSPIQRIKGELLAGEYFYYQMTHRKGIPYKVEGTIPVYIYENQFTIYLFNLEKDTPHPPPVRTSYGSTWKS